MLTLIATAVIVRDVREPIKLNDLILAAQCGFSSIAELHKHRDTAVSAGLLRFEAAESPGDRLYWLLTLGDASPTAEDV